MAEPKPEPIEQPKQPIKPQPIGTVKIKTVQIMIEGKPYLWKVKALSYAKKMEITKILSSMKPLKVTEAQEAGVEIKGQMAMDLVAYQLSILETNIVSTPDNTPVTREYVVELEPEIAEPLLDAISPDISITQKK